MAQHIGTVPAPSAAVDGRDADAGDIVVGPDDGHLPRPPGDAEKDLYFGPQWRWVAPVSFASYLLIVISVSFFIARHPWSAFLAAPLALSAVGCLVSLATSSRRRRWTLAEHRERVAAWKPDYIPAIDVFLPSAGEPPEVLENTYRHVARLQWHGDLTVYVLDDSAREEVRELARRHGFEYLTRPDRGRFKKAGNLRYGFERSGGDFILVLDADFVPRRDLFYELTPYFDDAEVAIVQSPQYFDVAPTMNWLQRAAGATQVLFYRWVQPSRDRSNAAICVGTSAMYRRAALDRSGGFAQIGHSEDVHTGVNLMKVGYWVRYVPILVTKGLCPDRLDQFLTQQYRWCTGSMSLLFSRGFHRLELTVMQRLCYWSGFLYYITTAVNVFVMAIPPILMGWFAADQVRPANYVLVALAMVGRQAIIPFITLERESLLGLARVQTTYSFCHAVALFDVLRGRTDSWAPTGARSRSRTAVRVRRLVRVWCVSVQVLLWAAIALHAPRYGLDAYWCMILFALVNLWVVTPIVVGRTEPAPRLFPLRPPVPRVAAEAAG